MGGGMVGMVRRFRRLLCLGAVFGLFLFLIRPCRFFGWVVFRLLLFDAGGMAQI